MAQSSIVSLRRALGTTDLSCHPLGFGCYRVAEGNSTHEAALKEYLRRGGNLVDTSANYGDGSSELMVGKILKEVPEQEAIVVTKGGYIQGQNMALALGRKFSEVVEYGEGLWHSIHPEFLETQVRRSAHRLHRNTLDVYLLHNPEYYLEDAAHQGKAGEKAQKEFYRRIREAFRFLEDKVSAGEIRWYGISSNNFGAPADSPTFTSIERCWEAAQSVSPQHHFRVAQMPVNLYESGAARHANNGGKTALAFCKERGIGVLVNRPLNAFADGRMIRLADFLAPGEAPPGQEQLHAALQPLHNLEAELRQQFDVPLLYGTPVGMADYLERIAPQITSSARWEQVYYRHLIQPLERWATECQQLYGDQAAWQEWWQRFSQMLPAALEATARHAAASQQLLSDQVWRQLQVFGYPDRGSVQDTRSLSQMALRVLLDLEGVSSVLVGMRRPEYVADAMAAAALEPVDSASILQRFAELGSPHAGTA